MRPGTQYKVDDFITEIFRIADTRRFFNFFQFRIQGFAVEQLAGIRVAVFLILDPEIGIRDIAIENVLPVFRVRFQIRRLDLFANKFRVFRD